MKKIIDILPPDGKKEILKIEEKKKKRSFKRGSKRKPFKINVFKKVPRIILGVLILLFLIWAGSYIYSKLTLIVKVKTEAKVFEQEVEVNTNQYFIDIENKIIRGKFFEQIQEKSMTFETEGKETVDEKAKGSIRVYNSQNPPRTIVLRELTRFLSAEGGRIFKSPEKIVLGPAIIKGGKIVPSYKDIEVVAQEGGEEYNIGPSNFSVPGLSGSALYYTVWAESDSPMEGGLKKEVNIITKEDLEKAENILKEELLKDTRTSLESIIPEDFVFNNDSMFVKEFQFDCSVEEGDRVSNFSCQGKIEIKALTFKSSELKELALDQIDKEIPSEKDFDIKSLSMEYPAKNLVGDSGKMILGLRTTVNLYDKISIENIIVNIKRKTKEEIETIVFESYPQIENIECKFWPFWIKKSPKNIERIEVLLNLQ